LSLKLLLLVSGKLWEEERAAQISCPSRGRNAQGKRAEACRGGVGFFRNEVFFLERFFLNREVGILFWYGKKAFGRGGDRTADFFGGARSTGSPTFSYGVFCCDLVKKIVLDSFAGVSVVFFDEEGDFFLMKRLL